MTLAAQFARESYTVDYAGFWPRLLALVIDDVILFAGTWLFSGLLALAFGRGWLSSNVEGGAVSGTGVYWLFAIAVPFLMIIAYFIGFWRWRGATPGKMLLGLRIVRFNGDSLGWGGAVMRFLGYIIAFMPLLVGLIWIAFDGRRQGWHDKLAETYVIHGRRR
jgi:uncharacterized RDD family membrane protein YckC